MYLTVKKFIQFITYLLREGAFPVHQFEMNTTSYMLAQLQNKGGMVQKVLEVCGSLLLD